MMRCAVMPNVALFPATFAGVKLQADTVDFCPAHHRISNDGAKQEVAPEGPHG
jgi:hypothetical protein